MNEHAHTYNLKAVVMETGLKPVTLRAWERRYGLPEPKRTTGGHRLYCQRDIDMLKWLVARQREGISISRAVTIWRNLEAEGQNPLSQGASVSRAIIPQMLPPKDEEQITELRRTWVEGCLAFDERHIEQVMTQAFSRFPAEVVCLELLQKGLAEIGRGWYEGKVTVQQEHFASTQAMRRLEMLVAAQPPPTRVERIVVGCAPKDSHTFSSLLLTFLLRRVGWGVIYLGADVPLEQMDQTIQATEPDLLLFTAQQLHTAVHLLAIAQLQQQHHIAFGFGGLAFQRFPGLKQIIPGYYLGDNLLEVPENVQRLFAGEMMRSDGWAPDDNDKTAHLQYEEVRGLIETALWASLAPHQLPVDLLVDVNSYLARDISAALKFGDIYLLDVNIEWLKTLIDNHGWPQMWLSYYLQAYYEAAAAHLHDPQHPLLVWLAAQVKEWRGDATV